MLALTLAQALTLMYGGGGGGGGVGGVGGVGGGVRSSFVVRAWLVEAEHVRGR